MSTALSLISRSTALLRGRDVATQEHRGWPRAKVIELACEANHASMSAAVQLLYEVQQEGDPVAWIQPEGGALFPPDLVANGVDLSALAVIQIPVGHGAGAAPKAAEMLLRSGALGAVVIDFHQMRSPRGDAWLARLASLAREQDARVVLIGAPGMRASFGAMVSLRLSVRRERTQPGWFCLSTSVLKDKGGVHPRLRLPVHRAPEGLL